MVKEVGDPMEGHGSFAASGSTLNHENLIAGVADDGILLLLNCADDIFQLDFAVASKLGLQDLIVDLGVALEGVDHFSAADLVLPFGRDLTGKLAHGSLVGSGPLVIVVKKAAHRGAPVIRSEEGRRFSRQSFRYRYRKFPVPRPPHSRNPPARRRENPAFSGNGASESAVPGLR